MNLLRSLTLLAAFSPAALAGGLYLEITKGAPGALLNATVTACHEPAKSIVTAHIVTLVNGKLERQPLQVMAVPQQVGVFAIAGKLPADNVVVELAVTNPQFADYQPRVLIRAESGKLQIATKQRFFSVPPKLADYRQVLLTD